jgi:hypothetical protein
MRFHVPHELHGQALAVREHRRQMGREVARVGTEFDLTLWT